MKLGTVNLANCLIFIIYHKINGIPEGVCYENKLVNGKEVLEAVCCYSYYKVPKGQCTECPAGSYGINCSENCSGNFYGRQCRSICNCEGRRCHYIFGCVGLSTTERKSTVTIELIQGISLTEMTKEWNKDVTSPKYEKEKESAFSMDQVIVIIVASSASTVVSMVIVIICMLILRRLLCEKQRAGRIGTSNEVIFTNDIRVPLSIPREHIRGTQSSAVPESQYETVDETNMIEISNVRLSDERSALRNTDISRSSSDSKTSNASGVASEDIEGYLHPYNTLQENWQNKGYQYIPCIVEKNKVMIP